MPLIKCRQCGEKLKVPDFAEGVGEKAECVHCGAMNDVPGAKKQKPASASRRIAGAVVCAALLIAVIVAFVRFSGEKIDPNASLWQCESCDERFHAVSDTTPIECEACQRPGAVRLHMYRCAVCSKDFIRFRTLIASVARGQPESTVPARHLQLRKPGGDWVSADSQAGRAMLKLLRCPSCGTSDPSSLKPVAAVPSRAAATSGDE